MAWNDLHSNPQGVPSYSNPRIEHPTKPHLGIVRHDTGEGEEGVSWHGALHVEHLQVQGA